MHSAFPHVLYVLAAAVICELGGIMLRRRGHGNAGRYLVWATRPFAVWALLSAYYELQPWSSFKRAAWVAFPVYATPWKDLAPEWPQRMLVALATATVTIAVLMLALRRPRHRAWTFLLLLSCVVHQLAAAHVPHDWAGPLQPWKRSYKGYAREADRVESASAFMRRFTETQASMHLHPRTHPPGATLLSYWTQRTDKPAVRRNVFVQLGLSSLVIPATWAIARVLTDPRTAVLAAALVGLMPAAAALGTYSMDPVFAVVLNLGLLSAVRLARGGALVINGTMAGLAFFAGSMLQYSWPVVAAAAVGAGIAIGRMHGLSGRSIAHRLSVPILVLLAGHVACRYAFGFDYVEAFSNAWGFHHGFYRLRSIHDGILAVVASPFDLLIGLGPVAAVAAVIAVARRGREFPDAFRVFAGAVLIAYGVPLFLGPGSMKFETARTWYWVLPTLAMLAAHELTRRHPRDNRPLAVAAAASAVAGMVLLCLFDFGR